MVGSIEETSPAPGIPGPAAAKTRQSINIFAWQGRDLRSACLKQIVFGADNEPPEEFSGIKERRQRTLQVIPPQAC